MARHLPYQVGGDGRRQLSAVKLDLIWLSTSAIFTYVNIERGYLDLNLSRATVASKLLDRIADMWEMNHHRRQKKRNMCAELVMIGWTEDGCSRNETGTLEDISATGACLYLEHSIPAETEVSLHYPKGKYRGKVKHCTSQEIGYLLGIEFNNGNRWSKLDFQPAHLLELRLLQPKKVTPAGLCTKNPGRS
jgi:PilZ domain